MWNSMQSPSLCSYYDRNDNICHLFLFCPTGEHIYTPEEVNLFEHKVKEDTLMFWPIVSYMIFCYR